MDVAIPRLRHCRNVTELSLHASQASTLALSYLARHLPQLKMLYIDLPITFTGSLESLHNVEELSLRGESGSYDDGDNWTAFMPSASAKTLTRLSLELGIFGFPNESPVLEEFVNLKHLTTKGVSTHLNLVEIIKHLPFELESLESSVYIRRGPRLLPHLGIVASTEIDPDLLLFDSQCLKHLKAIELHILCLIGDGENNDDFPSYYVENCMEVVEKMVKKIRFVEEAEIWAGCDLDRAPYLLSQLENLEYLTWNIPSQRYMQSMKEGQNPDDVFRNVFQDQGKEVDVTFNTTCEWNIVDGDLLRK
jgi:hypothetical protein